MVPMDIVAFVAVVPRPKDSVMAPEAATALKTGVSLTAVTLTVRVLAFRLVSTPPLAVPPASCTLKPIVA